MYEVWINFGAGNNREWKMIKKTDSRMEAQDTLLDAYVHRADDFISISMYDQFDNRLMGIDKRGRIDLDNKPALWYDVERK